MTNNPPAIIGVRIAVEGSFCRSTRSSGLRYSHLKTYTRNMIVLKIHIYYRLVSEWIWKLKCTRKLICLPNSNRNRRVGRPMRRCIEMCPCWWHQWRGIPHVLDLQQHVLITAPATFHCTHNDCREMWAHRRWTHRHRVLLNEPNLHVSRYEWPSLYLFWPIPDHLPLFLYKIKIN